MAKKPRSDKNKNPGTAPLLAALKFIEPATREIGQVNQTHCALGGFWAVAFDGTICIATKIDTDIVAYPHTKKLIAALTHCDEATQLTQLDTNRIAVKSGKYKAFIPCVEPGIVAFTPPDTAQYPIDERVKQSLEIVGKVAKENAPRMVAASVLLQNGSAVATDGNILVEHWHGWQLPSVVLPKTFITEFCKINKKLTHLGTSDHTATFWYDDGSFIRSQLYVEPYPELDRVTSAQGSQQPIPEGLFAALDKLDALKDDNKIVYFDATGIRTHLADEGAFYEFPGLATGIAFNLDYLRLLGPHVKTADFNVTHNNGAMAIFQGDNFRAFLMQMRIPELTPTDRHRTPDIDETDDDIPL